MSARQSYAIAAWVKLASMATTVQLGCGRFPLPRVQFFAIVSSRLAWLNTTQLCYSSTTIERMNDIIEGY